MYGLQFKNFGLQLRLVFNMSQQRKNKYNRHLIVHFKKKANLLQIQRKRRSGSKFMERGELAVNLKKKSINLPAMIIHSTSVSQKRRRKEEGERC